VNPEESIFNAKQIRKFKKLAKKLNKAAQGDEAVFCLKKKISALDSDEGSQSLL
jgi:hypothetical protein